MGLIMMMMGLMMSEKEEKEVKIRLSNDVYAKLVKYCESKGYSIRAGVEEILNNVFEFKNVDIEPSKPVLIITKFSGKCIKCGKEIGQGTSALWVKGLGLICLECSIPHDKALLKKYIKIKELELIKKQLSEEVESKYNELMSIEITTQVFNITKDVEKMLIKLKDSINQTLMSNALEDLKKTINQTIEYLERIDVKLNDLQLISKILMKKFKPIVKEKEKVEVVKHD